MAKNLVNSSIEDLESALERLGEAVRLSPKKRINKDGTIQRFEFSFELSWKTIKIFLTDQGIICKSPKDCFRKAADYGLIKSPKSWFDFLKARNNIAHTYNEKMADRIYKQAVKFPKAARNLLNNLVKYNK